MHSAIVFNLPIPLSGAVPSDALKICHGIFLSVTLCALMIFWKSLMNHLRLTLRWAITLLFKYICNNDSESFLHYIILAARIEQHQYD